MRKKVSEFKFHMAAKPTERLGKYQGLFPEEKEHLLTDTELEILTKLINGPDCIYVHDNCVMFSRVAFKWLHQGFNLGAFGLPDGYTLEQAVCTVVEWNARNKRQTCYKGITSDLLNLRQADPPLSKLTLMLIDENQ